jgi:hypothetical protein
MWPMSAAACAPRLVIGLLAQLAVPSPWDDVLADIHARDELRAVARLEAMGADPALSPEVRSHAWSWAGQLAARRSDLDRARADFIAAQRAAPGCFDARMAAVHEGEVDLRARRFDDAERVLATVERDPDPIVATYASARLRAVRERVRRHAVRAASVGLIALAAIALAVRAARVAPGARRRAGRAFGRALLLTGSIGVGAAVAVPRWTTSLAAPGCMAFAIPASVGLAWMWATRERGASRAAALATLLATAVVLAAALHLALDLTWWSVNDPML